MSRTFAASLIALCPLLAVAAPPAGLQPALEQWAARPIERYQFALADLDADGRPDAVLHVTDPSFCGNGGCPLLMFRNTGDAFQFISSSGNVRKPVYLLKERRDGWQTLAAMVGFPNAAGITPIPFRRPVQGYRSTPATLAQIELTVEMTERRLEFEEVVAAPAP